MKTYLYFFKYKALSNTGEKKEGQIDAVNKDLAISALQRRNLVVLSISDVEEKRGLQMVIFEKVPVKEIVMLSRQITTLFEAQVSALRAFRLLAAEARTPSLGEVLTAIANDLYNFLTDTEQ